MYTSAQLVKITRQWMDAVMHRSMRDWSHFVDAIHHFFDPAITFLDAFNDHFFSFWGKLDLFGAAVIGVFSSLDQLADYQLFHKLAGRGCTDIHAFADVGHAAFALVMQLHENAELWHR